MNRHVISAVALLLFSIPSIAQCEAAAECESESDCDPGVGVAVECDGAKKTIVIRETCVSEHWAKSCAARGIYSVWDLIEVGTSGDEKDRITGTSTAKQDCVINEDTFEIEIEPAPFNANVQGHCGASPTATVTVRLKGKELFSRQLLRNCDEGPETTRMTFDVSDRTMTEILEHQIEIPLD